MLSLSLSIFYVMMAGLVPRVSVPWIVHTANEVTPCTDWWPNCSDQAAGTGNRSRGNWHRTGIIPWAECALATCRRTLHQLLVEPVPLNTVKLPKRQNIFITVADGDFQCTYISFSQKLDAVNIFFCYLHLTYTSLKYACCIFLCFCELFFGNIVVRLTNSENST